MQQLNFSNRNEWRQWLEANHGINEAVWLVFYKKGTGKTSLGYNEAVEEALCFGWIDSIIKRIDEERYVRKFTPRKDSSVWSESNIGRVEKMMAEGKMAPPGMKKVKAAMQSGRWHPHSPPEMIFEPPPEFIEALRKSPSAEKYFFNLSSRHQKEYIGWIITAKREETRQKRIAHSLEMLEQGNKLGLK